MYLLKRLAKVKKKLFDDDKATEKDTIENTPNRNIEKINKKLIECQREVKKSHVTSPFK